VNRTLLKEAIFMAKKKKVVEEEAKEEDW